MINCFPTVICMKMTVLSASRYAHCTPAFAQRAGRICISLVGSTSLQIYGFVQSVKPYSDAWCFGRWSLSPQVLNPKGTVWQGAFWTIYCLSSTAIFGTHLQTALSGFDLFFSKLQANGKRLHIPRLKPLQTICFLQTIMECLGHTIFIWLSGLFTHGSRLSVCTEALHQINRIAVYYKKQHSRYAPGLSPVVVWISGIIASLGR